MRLRWMDRSSIHAVLQLMRRWNGNELYSETRRLDLVSQDTEVALKYKQILLQ